MVCEKFQHVICLIDDTFSQTFSTPSFLCSVVVIFLAGLLHKIVKDHLKALTFKMACPWPHGLGSCDQNQILHWVVF